MTRSRGRVVAGARALGRRRPAALGSRRDTRPPSCPRSVGGLCPHLYPLTTERPLPTLSVLAGWAAVTTGHGPGGSHSPPRACVAASPLLPRAPAGSGPAPATSCYFDRRLKCFASEDGAVRRCWVGTPHGLQALLQPLTGAGLRKRAGEALYKPTLGLDSLTSVAPWGGLRAAWGPPPPRATWPGPVGRSSSAWSQCTLDTTFSPMAGLVLGGAQGPHQGLSPRGRILSGTRKASHARSAGSPPSGTSPALLCPVSCPTTSACWADSPPPAGLSSPALGSCPCGTRRRPVDPGVRCTGAAGDRSGVLLLARRTPPPPVPAQLTTQNQPWGPGPAPARKQPAARRPGGGPLWGCRLLSPPVDPWERESQVGNSCENICLHVPQNHTRQSGRRESTRPLPVWGLTLLWDAQGELCVPRDLGWPSGLPQRAGTAAQMPLNMGKSW